VNSRTPYWPLFRNELGWDHYLSIPWVLALGLCLALWLAISFAPLLLLSKMSRGDLGFFFSTFGELTGFAMIWWLALNGWLFAFALLPGISSPLQGVRAFEFMFTRAIDRRRLFRTRAAVIYALMLGPLMLNVVVSFGLPVSVVFAANTFNEYGAGVLTGWVLWLGTLGLLFMQSYCVLIARRVQSNPWLAGIAIGAPVLVVCFAAPWVPRHHPHFYEESFLFFARNPVLMLIGLVALVPIVQILSERRFSKMEVL
jgi:hypothetical protein